MGFSAFSIFFLLAGIIVIQLLQKAGASMDWISFTIILFNFAVRCHTSLPFDRPCRKMI